MKMKTRKERALENEIVFLTIGGVRFESLLSFLEFGKSKKHYTLDGAVYPTKVKSQTIYPDRCVAVFRRRRLFKGKIAFTSFHPSIADGIIKVDFSAILKLEKKSIPRYEALIGGHFL